MDQIDRRILSILQRRGDISNADLAAEVATSPASVWRRVKALETAGVIGATVRLLVPEAIGRHLDTICQVRMRYNDDTSRGAFENFAADHPAIMECFSMSGEWDYLLRVSATDVRDYERFLMKELLAHPSVATSTSHFALKRVKSSTVFPV